MPTPTKNPSGKPTPSLARAFWPALIWAAVILVLTGLPGEDLPDIDFWDIDIEDKLAHLFVFAVLAGLIAYGAWLRGMHLRRRVRLGWIIIAVSGLYGGLTEVLQGTVFVGRFASPADFAADVLGSILGTVFVFFVLSRREKS